MSVEFSAQRTNCKGSLPADLNFVAGHDISNNWQQNPGQESETLDLNSVFIGGTYFLI